MKDYLRPHVSKPLQATHYNKSVHSPHLLQCGLEIRHQGPHPPHFRAALRREALQHYAEVQRFPGSGEQVHVSPRASLPRCCSTSRSYCLGLFEAAFSCTTSGLIDWVV